MRAMLTKQFIKGENWINGDWEAGKGSRVIVRNPADLSETVGEISFSTVDQAHEAEQAAGQAQRKWQALTRDKRGQYLYRLADALEREQEAIARLATREMGKPLKEMKGEVQRGIQLLKYYAGEGVRSDGTVIPSAIGRVHQYTKKVPLGVVALITPWNFPVAIPIWKMAPALICGNAVIWKPAESSSLTAYQLCRIFAAAGLPKGVINLLIGQGRDVGDALVRRGAIDALSFTGSTKTGRKLAALCAERNIKFQTEMGGKNSVVVLNDADLKLAVPAIVSGTFGSAGQKCTATGRIIVEAGIYDRFVEALVTAMDDVKLTNPLDDDCALGPVASKAQFDEVSAYVALAKKDAKILYENHDYPTGDGYYVHPLIVTGVGNDHPLLQEEIFGPIAAILKVDDYREAIDVLNRCDYGLSGAIFTQNLTRAFQFLDDAEIGMVRVNLETAGVEYQSPFGGMKQSSSHSREQGQAALDFYSTTKICALRF
jgi:aldehyde dehydrogenase (NAD+)